MKKKENVQINKINLLALHQPVTTRLLLPLLPLLRLL